MRSFVDGDFALSAFLCITLIEEAGKVIILGKRELGIRTGERGFYDHRRKYADALAQTLAVSSRTRRIYGEHEERFANWLREDELFTLRNRALYMEKVDDQIVTPHESISRDDAFLLVCFAGEI